VKVSPIARLMFARVAESCVRANVLIPEQNVFVLEYYFTKNRFVRFVNHLAMRIMTRKWYENSAPTNW
jgi:hypothetical protein